MARHVLLVLTLLCIYVTFTYAEETKEMTVSESQPNSVRCPDGTRCPNYCRCCPATARGSYFCCSFGVRATCCSDRKYCCPPGYACLTSRGVCVRLRDSPALPVQAILLVNSTDKRGSDGTEGMDPTVSKIIPSQQVETASKRNGFISTSGNVFSPDEKYHCPDGTSICELSSGIYGCCHLVRGRRILKHILP